MISSSVSRVYFSILIFYSSFLRVALTFELSIGPYVLSCSCISFCSSCLFTQVLLLCPLIVLQLLQSLVPSSRPFSPTIGSDLPGFELLLLSLSALFVSFFAAAVVLPLPFVF